MVVIPPESPVAAPPELTLAAAGLVLDHARPVVSGRLVPLEKMPTAVNACVCPDRISGLLGLI